MSAIGTKQTFGGSPPKLVPRKTWPNTTGQANEHDNPNQSV